MNSGRIEWLKSSPFLLIHLAALSVLLFPFSWKLAALAAGSYSLRMFAITAGYHRYFGHRAYKMGRIAQFAMAFLGGTSLQKGALWWAAHHRVHHRMSDTTADIHSPLQDGFWWSHVGWFLSDLHGETRWDQIADLRKFPELVWLNRWHWVPGMAYAAGMLALFGWAGFAWGFLLSTVLLWHGTFFINSLAHVFGRQRYETGDTSRNSFLLALLTFGEGWHNNHHCYPSSANQGFFWWEIDLSHFVLRGLAALGVVRDLRRPPLQLLEAKRVRKDTVTGNVPRVAVS